MIVVTVNSGSTSVKLAAYHASDGGLALLLRQRLEPRGGEERALLDAFLQQLPARPERMVHRVVHGGTLFHGPVKLDATTIRSLETLSELAPLHNPPALQWIAAARDACAAATIQIAAFDTMFFGTLPRVAKEYALPARLGVECGVQRYGFHGFAHQSMWRSGCRLNPTLPGGGRLITLQLGGGCSIAAIDRGQPLDISMGFSPLEGLVMATRSGDIDAEIVPWLAKRLGRSDDEIIALLNREAGLAGLSGSTATAEELLRAVYPQQRFAAELYCYRARKYVGAYLAVLGGCDGIVFGGGVGEHSPGIRERILQDFGWAGIALDSMANAEPQASEHPIHAPGSVPIYVVAVDEESELARAAVALP